MKINWKRKLTSRKWWVSVAALVSGLILAFGGGDEVATTVSGCIMATAAVVGYTIGEGLADSSRSKEDDNGDNI
nr:MAG TPA: holin [Caudoviricetes sp.]